jgi:hypothetical protein
MKKNAVLDTNIFLHYNIRDVDWCTELAANEVELIISFTVIRELDEKKQDRNDRKLAERARNNLLLIRSLNRKADGIRKNVKITVLEAEPKVDWDSLNLDQTINDDRIIASIIERNNATEDVLVTGDTGLLLKAKMKNIKCVELQANKLPEPKSAAEIELEKTRNQLQKYMNRTPKLSLFLYSHAQREDGPPTFFLKKPTLLSEVEIRQIIAEKGKQYDKEMGSSEDFLTQVRSFDMQAYIARTTYLIEYEKYLKKKNEIEELRCTTLEMKFDIISEGTAPAEDVICFIEFPEGFEIIEEMKLQELLREPEEPAMQSFDRFDPFGNRLSGQRQLVRLHEFLKSSEDSDAMSVRVVDLNTIKVKVKSILQEFMVSIDGLYAKISKPESVRNFEINCKMYASNLLYSPIEQKIPVSLER